jgi:hypothetical protein
MTRLRLSLCAAMIAALTPVVSLAHGPQLQITAEEGKIVTRHIILDGPYQPLTSPISAYVMPIQEFNGAWYTRPNGEVDLLDLPKYYSGPGLAYGLGQTFAVDGIFSISFTDGLKIWDGASFIDAGATQLQAFRGTADAPSATAATSDSAPFASLPFGAIAAGYDDEAHGTARFRLLGDGASPLTASPDGIYLASLMISSSEQGLAPSDPYYFVMSKHAPADELMPAIQSLGLPMSAAQTVPEPSAVVLAVLGIACCGLALRVRKERRGT